MCQCPNCGGCDDEPSAASPIIYGDAPCPACNGAGCKECEGRGQWLIKCCPRKLITADVHFAIRAVRLAESGALPIAGGQLDQTEHFIETWDLVRNEEEGWRNRLGLNNPLAGLL